MFTFSLFFAIAFAVVSGQQQYVGPIGQVSQQQSNSEASANAYASSQSSGNVISRPIAVQSPYTVMDPRAQTSYATESFHPNKGEILIHRPAPIIVKRPPTRVLVNHPPLVVKPAPVVLHKPPPVVLRKVYVKQHPRPVKVEPVYVNVVKPPAEKYYVNEKANQAVVGYPQFAVQGQAQSQAQAQAQAQAQSQSQSQGQIRY